MLDRDRQQKEIKSVQETENMEKIQGFQELTNRYKRLFWQHKLLSTLHCDIFTSCLHFFVKLCEICVLADFYIKAIVI